MSAKIIELKNINKSYQDNKILDDLNLYIKENEFITLLGPSGCGKTTTLRLIGGFEQADSGDIILDGVRINEQEAYQRPINTVFQKYALFPHLNVFDNIAFGLLNFNRTISDLKNSIYRKYENEKKYLIKKLKDIDLSKEEKKEYKIKLKDLKYTIKEEINTKKNELINSRLTEIENKYTPLIDKLDELIDIEWEKDDEVKEAKNRIKQLTIELEQLKENNIKNKNIKKIEDEIKKLQKVSTWQELERLEFEKKTLLKEKHQEIKSAKSLTLTKKQIEDEVRAALAMVKLEGYENRSIDEMSGGQQQRVAIARAIVNKPRILLLDEPLAALDLKLRQTMQYELKEMQRKLGITFVFVTHDQEEALTMSDTIVILNKGKIEQIGTPKDIYNEPKNRFVAKFIGESNIIKGIYKGSSKVEFFNHLFNCVDSNFKKDEIVDVVIRPEDFDIVEYENAPIKGIVTNVIFKGIFFEITAKIENEDIIIRKYENFNVGDLIGLSIDSYEIHLMKYEG